MGKKLTVNLEDFRGGTSTWWRNPLFPKYTYTDGIKAIAEDVGAYWIIDKVFSSQLLPELKNRHFQVWKWIAKDGKGVFEVSDGNNNEILNLPIDFTDFPDATLTFWFTDNVLLLPVEY